MFIYLLILIIDFVFFWKLNSKFVQTYPQYKGKYLWTLLFFPLFYFVNLIFFDVVALLTSLSFTTMSSQKEDDQMIMSLFRILRNWSFLFFFLFGAGVYFIYKTRIKLNKILFNWENNEKEALKLISIIFGIGIMLPSLYFIAIYLNISNNEWLWWYLSAKIGEDGLLDFAASSGFIGILFNVGIGYLIWYFSKKKLNSLSENIGIGIESKNEETFISTHMSDENQYSRDSINKLKDLKQLFDDGVLSEEEFISMKQEILKEGI